jgi:hypothetical protein
MSHVTAFCITLLAVSFIIVTAAGSILLATIPPQNAKSSVSANMPGGDQGFDQAKLEVQGTQPHKKTKYALVCGIVVVNPNDFVGKPVPPPPPPKGDRPGACILFDVSTSKASKVPGELQASKLIHKVDPIYPESAIKGHVGIRVALHISVNEEGLVTDAEVTKSQTVPPDRDSQGNWVGGVHAGIIKGINSATINAVKQWKYSPTLLDGKAIPVMATVSIDFTFNKDGSPKIVTYAP